MDQVAQQQHVDVHRPGTVADRVRSPAQLVLHRLAGVEQLLRVEVGLHPQAGVEEVGLVEDLALRLGLVDRGGAKHRHAVGGERVTGCAKVRDAFADVGAEAEVALQLPSFQTSTETSSTGRGIGGSGLDARTVTASAP